MNDRDDLVNSRMGPAGDPEVAITEGLSGYGRDLIITFRNVLRGVDGTMLDAALGRAIDLLAQRIVEEHAQEILAKVNPDALANTLVVQRVAELIRDMIGPIVPNIPVPAAYTRSELPGIPGMVPPGKDVAVTTGGPAGGQCFRCGWPLAVHLKTAEGLRCPETFKATGEAMVLTSKSPCGRCGAAYIEHKEENGLRTCQPCPACNHVHMPGLRPGWSR